MSSRGDRQLSRFAERRVSLGLKSLGRPLSRRLLVEPLEDRSLLSVAVTFGFPIGAESADSVDGLVVDAQGNELVTGGFSGTLDFDPGPGLANLTANVGTKAFAAKYTPSGALVWARAFGLETGWWGARGNSIAVGPDGSVVVVGEFGGTVDFDPGPAIFELTSTGFADSFVCKLDSDGNLLWAKALGEGEPHSVAIGPDSSVHIAGRQIHEPDLDPGPGGYKAPAHGFVCKLTDRGDFVWAHGWGIPNVTSAEPEDIAVDRDGRVYFTGWFSNTVDFDPGPGTATLTSTSDSEDFFVVALDAGGDFAWAVGAGSPVGERGSGITVAPDGNLYVTGSFYRAVDFDPGPATSNLVSAGESDIFLWKLSAAGSFMWARRFGGEDSDFGSDVAVGPDGRVAVTGILSGTADFGPGTPSATGASWYDVAVLVLDSAGTPLWAGSMGGFEPEDGRCVAMAPDGAICVGGVFRANFDVDPGPRTQLLTPRGSLDGFVCRLVVAPGPDPSPLSPLGGEFRVNNTPPGQQMMPSLAMDRSGNFAVAWSTPNDDIYLRRYDAAGNPISSDLPVAQQETGPGAPDIAMAPDGRFVVAWTNENVDGQGEGIAARLYDAGGNPQGPAFQVTADVAGDQYGPRAAMDASGAFVVVWESTGEPTGLYFRQFAADGTPLAPPVRLDDLLTIPGYPNYRDTYPDVAVDPRGNGMVVWTNQMSGGWAISARRFSAAGVMQEEFQVVTFNSPLVRPVDQAAVAMNASGQAVVAWDHKNLADERNYADIHARRFDAAGAPVGSEFLVNTTVLEAQDGSAIALRDDGSVALTWMSMGQDGSWYGVYARVFDGMNRPITPEILVPTTTESNQMYQDVAVDNRGHMVVVWQHDWTAPGDNDGCILGQQFSLPVESDPPTTCGLYDPATSLFYLRDQQTGGDADHMFAYGVPGVGWMELVGDWDGDGMDTPGFYDPATATFYLTNRLEGGNADLVFQFGIAGQGWKPLVGDWNGDGQDGIGLYEPATSLFFFKNSFTGGDADEAVQFGVGSLGWIPIAGDWDGIASNGDGFGFYEPAISAFWLKNARTSGPAEECFQFGMGSLGWTVLAGDWDGTPGDGVGFYVPATGQWFLKNAHAPGDAEISFTYGIGGAGWRPLVGCWTGGSVAAATPAVASAPPAASGVDRLDLAALAAQLLQPAIDNRDLDQLFGNIGDRRWRSGGRR